MNETYHSAKYSMSYRSVLLFSDRNNCSIKSLSQYTFMNVTCIRTLAISWNPSLTTEDVQRSFKYLNISCLRTIVLTYNSWNTLPNGMFHSLSRIEHIDLSGNKLRILNCTEFADLHALLSPNVRSNYISDTENITKISI
jgi:hypothetical protein